MANNCQFKLAAIACLEQEAPLLKFQISRVVDGQEMMADIPPVLLAVSCASCGFERCGAIELSCVLHREKNTLNALSYSAQPLEVLTAFRWQTTGFLELSRDDAARLMMDGSTEADSLSRTPLTRRNDSSSREALSRR